MAIEDDINNTINEFMQQAGIVEDTVEEIAEETIQEETVEENTNFIPNNSETALISEYTSRFSGADWFNQVLRERVLVAGIGGIGSYVSYLMSRLNVESLILYDDDKVEEGNLSGQLFMNSYIGQSKVSSARMLNERFSSYYKTNDINTKYTHSCIVEPNMICGFDNMAARKTFFESWNDYRLCLPFSERENLLYIDARLAAEELQVFCFKGNDDYHINKYKDNWLFSDSEAEETQCSYKQTSHMANMIGSIIVNLFVNNSYNKCEGVLFPRPVPFLTIYDSSLMLFKTID